MSTLWVCLLLAQVSAEPGYEDRLVGWALEQQGRAIEPTPEGKRVDEVLVSSENVFAASDPWPSILNVFHWRTREAVIRREVLLTPGDVWTGPRVMETERNLRRLFFLAVVKVVPVKSPSGGVGLLVVTKDRWSLRLSNSFTLIGPLLQTLSLSLTEINFNGWGQSVALNTVLRLDTLSLGQTFIERRLFGSRLYFGESAALILNRYTGTPEGTSGAVVVGRPIITLDQTWGALVNADWNVRRRRVFRGASIWQLPYSDDETPSAKVPYVYDVREVTTAANFTRSFGRATKLDLTGELGGYFKQYAPPAGTLNAAQAQWLVSNYLPRSENVTYVSAYARAFPADYKILRNIDAFELSEDFQIGWLAQVGARYAFPLPFAPSHFIELGGAVRYRFYRGDDLFTVSVAGAMRVRPGDTIANRRLAAEVINYSPSVYGGRFVTRVMVDFIANDLNNRQLLLGGSTGLRGTLAEQFTGKNLVLANVEYRARPFEVLTSWLGLVIFYDVGSAFNSVVSLTHTTGIGLRIMLPQLNQDVLRIDFGLVIGGPNASIDRLNATWGQVTDIRPSPAAGQSSSFLDQPL